jgi:YD repeat-containing protein
VHTPFVVADREHCQAASEIAAKTFVVDYTSAANRDIMVIEDGSWVQRWVYDASGNRLSVEITHADGTMRGSANADGDFGASSF